MATLSIHYDNLKDRQNQIQIYEAQGWRMLFDNFDPDWKHSDEPHGMLIWTDEPSPVSPLPAGRDLNAELDSLKQSIKSANDFPDLQSRLE